MKHDNSWRNMRPAPRTPIIEASHLYLEGELQLSNAGTDVDVYSVPLSASLAFRLDPFPCYKLLRELLIITK